MADDIQTITGANKTTAAPTKPVGVVGFVNYGGWLGTNEKNARLVGVRKYETYGDILANNTIVAAGIRYYLNMVSKAQWRFDPASTPNGEYVADQVEKALTTMDTAWFNVVRRAAMYRFYGFSVQEKVLAKHDDGVIGYRDVMARPQRTIEQWETDMNNGAVLAVGQRSPQDGSLVKIDRARLVYVVDDAINDSPEGLGLFRHIVEANNRLKSYERLEGVGYEQDLNGIPVAKVPLGEIQRAEAEGQIDAATKSQMLSGVQSFLNGGHQKSPYSALMLESATYPQVDGSPSNVPLWDLQTMTVHPAGQQHIHKAIIRVQQEIARVLNVEHLLLGNGDGSHALGVQKANDFALVVDGTLQELATVFQRDLVYPMCRKNGWALDDAPTLKTESMRMSDVTEVAKALRDLSTAGVVLTREDEAVKEIFDDLGLSRLQDDELLKDSILGG